MTQQTSSSVSRLGLILAYAAIYVIWGSTYLAIRFAVQDLPPFLMAAARFIVSGTILFVIMRLQRVRLPSRLQWRSAIIVGGLLLVGGNGGVTWAEQKLPSALVALLVATVPLWMVLVDWLRPNGTRPGRQVWLGVAAGLIGMLILIGPGELADGTRLHPPSVIVMLFAPLAWAVGSIYSRHTDLPESPLMGTAIEMLGGGVLLTVLGLATGEAARLDLAAVSLKAWASWGYLVIFGSLVAFSAYVWLLRVSTPARVATYAYVNPVIAVLLGWLFASEPIDLRTIIAGGIIVGSVVLINTYRAKAAAKPEPKQAVAPRVDDTSVALASD